MSVLIITNHAVDQFRALLKTREGDFADTYTAQYLYGRLKRCYPMSQAIREKTYRGDYKRLSPENGLIYIVKHDGNLEVVVTVIDIDENIRFSESSRYSRLEGVEQLPQTLAKQELSSAINAAKKAKKLRKARHRGQFKALGIDKFNSRQRKHNNHKQQILKLQRKGIASTDLDTELGIKYNISIMLEYEREEMDQCRMSTSTVYLTGAKNNIYDTAKHAHRKLRLDEYDGDNKDDF